VDVLKTTEGNGKHVDWDPLVGLMEEKEGNGPNLTSKKLKKKISENERIRTKQEKWGAPLTWFRSR